MTDSLEVDDFPELSDVLSVPVGLSGERSRMPGSRSVGLVGGCSSSLGLVRPLASMSVPSDSETGDKGRFWDWTSMSIPCESWPRPLIGEVGKGRVTGDNDLGDGSSVTTGGVCPETTPAKVRGLVGGIVDMASTFGAVGGPTGFVSTG